MADSLRWQTPNRPISFALRRTTFLLLVLVVAVLVVVQSAGDFGYAYKSFQAQRAIDSRSNKLPPRSVGVVVRKEFRPSKNGAMFTGYTMAIAQTRCASKNGVIKLPNTPTSWCSWSLVNPGDLWPHLRKCPGGRKIGWIEPDICREGVVTVRGSGRAISFGEFTGANSWLRLAFASFLKNLIVVAAYVFIVGALSVFSLIILHSIYGQMSETEG